MAIHYAIIELRAQTKGAQMKLKNIVISNGRNYLYQRRYPKALQGHPQIKQPIYRRSMGVTTSSADEEILAAHKYAHTNYENYIAVLALVNLDQLSQADKIKKAQSLIDVAGLKAGMLADDPNLGRQQQQALREDAWEHIEHTGIFPDLNNPDLRPKQGEPLSPNQEIQDIAFKLLAEPAGPKGRSSIPMLSDCWAAYLEAKSINLKTVSGQQRLSEWKQFLGFAGDTIMSNDTVQDALELYVEKLFKTGIKGTTVETRLGKVLAIIRHSIKLRRLPIVIVKPEIKGGSDYADDYVLNAQEEQALMALLGTMKPSWKTAALALMLETGCYASELQRLDEFNVHLDDPIPHIILKNKTMKTKSRPRVLTPISPTTLRLLRGQLFTRNWVKFQSKNGSVASQILKSVIQKVAPLGTARSLRHGTRNRLMAAGIPFDLQALIGGWSAGLNTVQMGYGRAGITDERTLLTLQTALRKANGNMEPQGLDNVVQLKGVLNERTITEKGNLKS
jgi:integrase